MCLTSFKSLNESLIRVGEGSENRSFWICDPGPRLVGQGNRLKIMEAFIFRPFPYVKTSVVFLSASFYK
jgi:hypothetical protein